MATTYPVMKTNLFIGFIVISGVVALAFGMVPALSLVCAAAVLGTVCADYTTRSGVKFGSAV